MALDVGEKRVGLAYARHDILVPVISKTLLRQSESFWQDLSEVISSLEIGYVILGLPRGLDGQDTDQTRYVQNFASEFQQHFNMTPIWQDEALTSVNARAILDKDNKPYNKEDVDGLAASMILGDYLETHGKLRL